MSEFCIVPSERTPRLPAELMVVFASALVVSVLIAATFRVEPLRVPLTFSVRIDVPLRVRLESWRRLRVPMDGVDETVAPFMEARVTLLRPPGAERVPVRLVVLALIALNAPSVEIPPTVTNLSPPCALMFRVLFVPVPVPLMPSRETFVPVTTTPALVLVCPIVSPEKLAV